MKRTLTALALLLALPSAAGAATGAECLTEMARAETTARVTFEEGLADLVAEADPGHAELVGLTRDLQVALARDRLDRLEYLAETRPGAFEGQEGSVNWTAEDEEGFAADADHAARLERIAELAEATRGHPDAAALQDFFRTAIVGLLEFQQLMVDHNMARKAAADAFAACRQ